MGFTIDPTYHTHPHHHPFRGVGWGGVVRVAEEKIDMTELISDNGAKASEEMVRRWSEIPDVAKEIINDVLEEHGVYYSEIVGPMNRGRRKKMAMDAKADCIRKLSLYKKKRVFLELEEVPGFSTTQIGQFLDLDHSTVMYHRRKIFGTSNPFLILFGMDKETARKILIERVASLQDPEVKRELAKRFRAMSLQRLANELHLRYVMVAERTGSPLQQFA